MPARLEVPPFRGGDKDHDKERWARLERAAVAHELLLRTTFADAEKSLIPPFEIVRRGATVRPPL